MSSLPVPVDIEDWVDQDLPAAIDVLAMAVPVRVRSEGWSGGYSSVARDAGVDSPGPGRVLALLIEDDEYGDELVRAIGNSAELGI